MARSRRPIVVAAVLAGLAILPFANSFENELVAGDLQFIAGNEAIRGVGVVEVAFTRGYWYAETGAGGEGQGYYYRPLVVLLDALDVFLWGERPFGFHLTNVALHVVATLLVHLLARRLGFGAAASAVAAGLFAIHPVHVHAVTYVSGRTGVLAACFFLASLLQALREGPARFGAIPLFAAALLSKEEAATLPVVAVLALALHTRTTALQTIVRERRLVAGLVLAFGGYMALRAAILGAALTTQPSLFEELGPARGALTTAKIIGFYLDKLLLPRDHSYLPPFVPALEMDDVGAWSSVVVVAATVAFAVWAPARFRLERFGVGWVLVTLLPVSGVVHLDYFVKENFAYLPSVGFAMLMGSLAIRLLEATERAIPAARARRYAIALASGVAMSLVLVTWTRNTFWRDQLSVCVRVVETEPRIPDHVFAHRAMRFSSHKFATAEVYLAQAAAGAADCESAMRHVDRTMRLARHQDLRDEAEYVTAWCRFIGGRLDEAAAIDARMLDRFPDRSGAAFRLAAVAELRGDAEAMARYLEIACRRGHAVACQRVRGRPSSASGR